jgi:hypothetical protein
MRRVPALSRYIERAVAALIAVRALEINLAL